VDHGEPLRAHAVRDRHLALVLADADQRGGERRERALDDDAEALARRRDLADEREAVRRVNGGQPARPRREAPDHARFGGVRVHEVEPVERPRERGERACVEVRARVLAHERQPPRIEHDGLVPVLRQPLRELSHMLRDAAVGRLADEGDPSHGRESRDRYA
jgi:hypothetical protein